jgi:hypothetical protein
MGHVKTPEPSFGGWCALCLEHVVEPYPSDTGNGTRVMGLIFLIL